MRTFVAIAIMLLVGLLAGLMIYLLARRLVTGWLAAVEARRRASLEEKLYPWFSGASAQTPPVLRRLRRWPDRRLFIELCLAWLPEADAPSRQRLIDWLEENGYVDQWIAQLGHRDPWKRERAAQLLGVARSEEAVEPLVEALDDPALDVRMRAAAALGALGGQAARSALIEALTDQNRWSTIRIADLMSEMGPEVGEEVLQAYPRMSRGAQLAAIDLLARIGGARTGAFFKELLIDPDRDIRARAAAALGRTGYRPAVPWLLEALLDEAWPVRAMSAKALGAMRVEEAIPRLCAALRDQEWWVRANSAQALDAIGPAGRFALESMRDDEDRFARDQAHAVLAKAGVQE